MSNIPDSMFARQTPLQLPAGFLQTPVMQRLQLVVDSLQPASTDTANLIRMPEIALIHTEVLGHSGNIIGTFGFSESDRLWIPPFAYMMLGQRENFHTDALNSRPFSQRVLKGLILGAASNVAEGRMRVGLESQKVPGQFAQNMQSNFQNRPRFDIPNLRIKDAELSDGFAEWLDTSPGRMLQIRQLPTGVDFRMTKVLTEYLLGAMNLHQRNGDQALRDALEVLQILRTDSLDRGGFIDLARNLIGREYVQGASLTFGTFSKSLARELQRQD